MLPFAVTLARNGYVAVTFDFPGHGRNPVPLLGGLADDAKRNDALLGTLDEVVAFARAVLGGDAGMALLGHSMASDIVVRYAMEHPDIAATVAVSLFSPAVTASSPRNLLVIAGALEPAMIVDEGRRVAGLGTGRPAEDRTTYGSFDNGTARRLALAGGVEHIGVLFSRQSMAEALGWLDQAFARRGSGYLDERAPWLGMLMLGVVALGWPLAGVLPRVAAVPQGAGLRWRRLLPVALLSAILVPLILWKVPTGFLPSLLGDYLAVHYATLGLLIAAGLALAGAARPALPPAAPFAIATVALAAYCVLAVGAPIDRYVTSFVPAAGRWPILLAVLVGTAAYCAADEWLTRGPGRRRGAYAVTKALFLLSLVLAIALNPGRLFFLIIIVPVIFVFLIVYGLFSGWACHRTRQPLVGAVAVALAFAWAIASVFPVVG